MLSKHKISPLSPFAEWYTDQPPPMNIPFNLLSAFRGVTDGIAASFTRKRTRPTDVPRNLFSWGTYRLSTIINQPTPQLTVHSSVIPVRTSLPLLILQYTCIVLVRTSWFKLVAPIFVRRQCRNTLLLECHIQ